MYLQPIFILHNRVAHCCKLHRLIHNFGIALYQY